ENKLQDVAIAGLAAKDVKQDKQINDNKKAIANETNRAMKAEKQETKSRMIADALLDSKINNETRRAEMAEGMLGKAIATESTSRQIADAFLNQQINKVNNKLYSGKENVSFNSIKIGKNKVSSIDNGTKSVKKGDNHTLATTATVIKSAENGTYTNKVAPEATNVKSATINGAIADLDKTVGDRNINSANASVNDALKEKSIAAAIETTGNLIGDMDFSKSNYVSDSGSITSAINTLDANLNAVDRKYKNLGYHVDHVENHLRGGIAATAALTALVPNARACGNTQVSVGTGNYADKVGFAAGLFHYFSDRVLVNAGGSYATSNDWAFRAGITIGL
ncbi:MAG: YadA C-terminal domain-containing protein, partial [Proteobacteria bacterium]|nr:YadA C-terminal domain-containing protein [Candidatus Enterousia scatequi]